MTTRKLLWLIPLTSYLALAYWYTNTSGPLKSEEIRSFTQKAIEAGFQSDWIEPKRAFMSSDTGRQFFMVNVIDLNEDPPHVEETFLRSQQTQSSLTGMTSRLQH